MDRERLQRQIDFIREVDKIKNIFRQTRIHDGSRYENDAEHSWHLALMTMLLFEHANAEIDILKVMRMVIIHDIVEIDAGDTFCYDAAANIDKLERENKAAERIFGILPEDQGSELKKLWIEFDEMKTPEARFAASLDRLQPVLLNYMNKGGSWQEHDVASAQVIKRNSRIADGSSELWDFAAALIEDAVQKGYLKR